jgi:hypothetical protein
MLQEHEEMQLKKVSAVYHASRFLVVSQPGEAYAVAVLEAQVDRTR